MPPQPSVEADAESQSRRSRQRAADRARVKRSGLRIDEEVVEERIVGDRNRERRGTRASDASSAARGIGDDKTVGRVNEHLHAERREARLRKADCEQRARAADALRCIRSWRISLMGASERTNSCGPS